MFQVIVTVMLASLSMLGTNSTRLLVARFTTDGFEALERRTTITRLGDGVDSQRDHR